MFSFAALFPEGRAAFKGAATNFPACAKRAFGFLLFAASVLLLASGCGSAGRGGIKKAAEPPAKFYPYNASAALCFRLGPEGLEPSMAAPATSGSSGATLAALAPRVAALASGSGASGASLAALALNRYGYALLEPSPDGSSYRLSSFPLAEASRLSVANLWPREKGFLLQLYRDPFATAAGLASGRELFAVGEDGAATPLPRLGEGDEELFALQPSGGRWYAELRAEAAGKARLRYLSLESPDSGVGGGAMRDIGKAGFERALEPRAMGAAPEALRSAAAALAPGALLIRARDDAGTDCYWLSGGGLEDAREASAWLSDDGASALVVERSGAAAYATDGSCRRFSIPSPAKGAVLTAVALLPLGTKNLALLAWETGNFPSVEASGLLVLPLAQR
jgi:hypothetical protein